MPIVAGNKKRMWTQSKGERGREVSCGQPAFYRFLERLTFEEIKILCKWNKKELLPLRSLWDNNVIGHMKDMVYIIVYEYKHWVEYLFLECPHSRMWAQWLSLYKISKLKKTTHTSQGPIMNMQIKGSTSCCCWENRKAEVLQDHVPNRACSIWAGYMLGAWSKCFT